MLGVLTDFRFLSLLVLFCLRLYVQVNSFSVLSNRDEVSCSMTQHRALGEDRTRDLAIESDALPTELSVLPSSFPVGARLFVLRPIKNTLIEAYTFCY